jgi:hypothetical protein
MKLPEPAQLMCLLALMGSLGCSHTEPFGPRDFGTNQPFDPTPPLQLTLNRGPDRRAAWLPDGSAILYSTQRPATPDNDVCLASLLPSGGSQRSLTCDLSPDGVNLTEALESAAPASDGRLAFVGATSAIGALFPVREELALGSIDDPSNRSTLLVIPYTLPGRRTHSGISQVRWLSLTRIVYLAEAVTVFSPCDTCQKDTVRTGLDAMWLDLALPGSPPQPIPGTDDASGVSPGGSEDEVYYTLNGDSRVYRRILSTGEVSVAFDFGAAGIARDVQVVGDQATVVVGGRVNFADNPTLGPTQWDSGGTLHVVNLRDGTDQIIEGLSTPVLFRRPQLSPSGAALVVEAYPLVISTPVPGSGVFDTTVSRVGDLYLLGQP